MAKERRLRKTTDALEESEYFALSEQYEKTPSPDESFGASGEHYRLWKLLYDCGYDLNSNKWDAYELAGALLSKGWVSDGTYK